MIAIRHRSARLKIRATCKIMAQPIFERFCRDLLFDLNSQPFDSKVFTSSIKDRRKVQKAVSHNFASGSLKQRSAAEVNLLSLV